jgi:hypothetical protein
VQQLTTIFSERKAERERDRETERQRDTNREKERETEREKYYVSEKEGEGEGACRSRHLLPISARPESNCSPNYSVLESKRAKSKED